MFRKINYNYKYRLINKKDYLINKKIYFKFIHNKFKMMIYYHNTLWMILARHLQKYKINKLILSKITKKNFKYIQQSVNM